MTPLALDQTFLSLSLEFVLPGEVIDHETRESCEHLTVRHRKLSFDKYSDGSIQDLEANCMTVVDMSPEIKNQNSPVVQRQSLLRVKDIPNHLELQLDCMEEIPKYKEPREPVSRRVNTRPEYNVADIQYYGIATELARSLENEVRRALMKVVRNDEKAFKVLGISSS